MMDLSLDTSPAARRRQFCEDHPEISITRPADNGTRCWLAYCDGAVLAADYNLALLMDDLDWLMSETDTLFAG